jgi:hypothetical protein
VQSIHLIREPLVLPIALLFSRAFFVLLLRPISTNLIRFASDISNLMHVVMRKVVSDLHGSIVPLFSTLYGSFNDYNELKILW